MQAFYKSLAVSGLHTFREDRFDDLLYMAKTLAIIRRSIW